MKNSLLLIVFFCTFFHFVSANETKPVIYSININSEIGSTSRIYLSKGLKEAQEYQSKAVLLHLNTYGGTVVDADSMRSAILYSPIPVYVFIDNNAASAGALISLACQGIYMRKGASIGAATVVDPMGEAMPDKYQSYMRSIIRATAESHGKKIIIQGKDTTYQWVRDPLIAEAMVDDRIYIPGVIDSGKVLTLTAQEAVRLGFCDGIAETKEEVITQYLGHKDYRLIEYKPSFFDNMKGFLLNPVFQAILIMIILAGIYFELQTPGMGFPSMAAVLAAVLYFLPLYIDGLAQHWEIVIFTIGIILVLLEIFVIPGFGITGISGITLIALGLCLAMLNNDFFSFKNVTSPEASRSVLTVLSGMLLGFIALLYLSSRIGEKGLFRKIALITDLQSSESVDVKDKGLVGQTGESLTVLRPSGKIKINDEVFDAISNFGFIEKGEPVVVVKFENMQLYVEKR